MNLEPPDTMYVSAAIGWLELGNLAEAKAELDRVSRADHPDVLEARWLLLAQEEDWNEGLKIANRLMKTAPERVSAWLHRAYASRRAARGSVEKAWKLLLPAAELFPDEPTIPYNLACYACQMGRLDDARHWLGRAVRISGAAHVKQLGLADTDLEPLHGEIGEL